MSARGYTFIELLVVTTILLILASAVMPLAQVTSQRQREAELHRSLREVRTAIDKFKDAVDKGMIAPTSLEPGNEGFEGRGASAFQRGAIEEDGDCWSIGDRNLVNHSQRRMPKAKAGE